ncbi:MAG: hypothetical protein WKG07_12055 [Hymenobacter sp.]
MPWAWTRQRPTSSARSCQLLALAGCLKAGQPRHRGLLTSAALAGLCRGLAGALSRLRPGRRAAHRLRHRLRPVPGLTDRPHRLGHSYKRTTAVPCQADAAALTAFLTRPRCSASAAGNG